MLVIITTPFHFPRILRVLTDFTSINVAVKKVDDSENAEGKVEIKNNEEETEEPGNVDISMSDDGTEV